jgi:peptidoglycan/xylan/chitin deacetylase (PgdA/CDA1 family)
MTVGFEARRWSCAIEEVPCLTLKLPHSWEEYLQHLKPRFRTKLRSGLAFIEGTIRLAPVACTSEEQLETWLPEFFRLHEKRWKSRGQSGVFQSAAKREFYSKISRAALKAGSLSFHRLAWGERTIAFQYGFLYGNRFLLLQEAYDPAFESLRPGLALRAFLLRDMIAAGMEEYDFLAGVAGHKVEWGASPKRSLKIVAARPGVPALALVKAPAARAALKESLRRLVPEPVLEFRRRLLAKTPERDSSSTTSKASLQSAIAQIYSATPLRSLGRHVSVQYQLGNGSRKSAFPMERRKTHICHILIYHRVNDDHDPFLSSVSVNSFREQMEYLARHFTFVSLDDIAAGKINTNAAKYSVAITFDDGYRDNFTHALPILKELRIPATIFLATGYIGTGQLPWYDKVCLAFKLTTRSSLGLGRPGSPAGSLDGQSRLAIMQQVLGVLRGLDDHSRQGFMDDLFRALGVPSELALPNFMLNWDEVRQMRAHNISFGAHTVTHPVFSQIKTEQLQSEISQSKKLIEQKLQTEVIHFAYPFGKPADIGSQARSIVQQNGFKTAVTTIPGFNAPEDDLLALKRFTPWATGMASFILKLDWMRFAGFPETSIDHQNAALGLAQEAQEVGL